MPIENIQLVQNNNFASTPTKNQTSVKKENIQYKIRWGDTLWDISDAYYRTPWKYSKIANYNRIRNPDYIISGTTIIIPAE